MPTRPTPEDAAANVAEVDAARRAVDTAHRRNVPIMLAATSVLTFLDFAAKDEITGPRRRMVASAVIQAALLGLSLLDVRGSQVVPYAPGDGPQPALAGKIAGVGLGWYAAERVAVHLIRRSRLTRPNTVAGLVLAVSRPAGYLAVTRMLPRAGRDA
ncbi:hypothetical protein [Pseudonocardia sp. NPDC046786]|uniref:hypothetical protein n=1 Tax=Pseudonocardia sp. NPDC046786 TaxID=3155471 RepID=UPI0033C6E54C